MSQAIDNFLAQPGIKAKIEQLYAEKHGWRDVGAAMGVSETTIKKLAKALCIDTNPFNFNYLKRRTQQRKEEAKPYEVFFDQKKTLLGVEVCLCKAFNCWLKEIACKQRQQRILMFTSTEAVTQTACTELCMNKKK